MARISFPTYLNAVAELAGHDGAGRIGEEKLQKERNQMTGKIFGLSRPVSRSKDLKATRPTKTILAGSIALLATLLQAQTASAAPTITVTPERPATYSGDAIGITGVISNVKNANGANYNWSVSGTGATLASPLSGKTPNATLLQTFKATGVTAQTSYNVALDATDPSFGGNVKVSAPVTVYPLPIANAGPDVHANENSVVTLNGSATAAPGATFKWTAPDGITLSSQTAAKPTFTAPAVGRSGRALVFKLDVTEQRNGLPAKTSSDDITVNVDDVNSVPVAYASVSNTSVVTEGSVFENTLVTLYATGSDADGDSLTPTWTQVRDLAGTPLQSGDLVVQLSDSGTSTPSFTAPNITPAQGSVDLFFRLTVNDGATNSGPAYVKVTVKNSNDKPTALLTIVKGADGTYSISVDELQTFTLDGSASSDPNGDTLTYAWTQVGSPTILAMTPSLTLTAPEVAYGGQTFTYQLTVSDAEFSDTLTVSVTVANVNHAPVADAGGRNTDGSVKVQSVPARSDATLDGSASGDVDGDKLTYSWIQLLQPGQVPVDLIGANTATPTFVTPTVGPGGETLTFQLTVDDGYGGTATDTVQIQVSYVNRKPTANAGATQNVNERTPVSLGGSGTDPDSNVLTYAWSEVSNYGVVLTPDPADPSKATFTAPEVTNAGGAVVMRLTVDDGYEGVATSDVTINVANVNNTPTATAGASQTVQENDLVQLNGSGDDLDKEEVSSLTYKWTQLSGPTVTLSGSGKDVSFTAPEIPNANGDPNASAKLTFRLKVCDINGASATDDVDVTVANVPHAPTAVAGGPDTVNENGEVTLNGSQSTDPDGDALSYSWTVVSQPAGANIVLNDANCKTPWFVAPIVSAPAASATVKVQLTVNDGFGGTSTDCKTITVINSNTPPALSSNVRASEEILWSPDHRLVPVQILGVTGTNPTITIDSVTQDESTNGLGDGDTAIDAFIQTNGTVLLRAERSGKGDGRVYRVNFTASDFESIATGTSPKGCVLVKVPKSKKTDPIVDSIPDVSKRFDSTK